MYRECRSRRLCTRAIQCAGKNPLEIYRRSFPLLNSRLKKITARPRVSWWRKKTKKTLERTVHVTKHAPSIGIYLLRQKNLARPPTLRCTGKPCFFSIPLEHGTLEYVLHFSIVPIPFGVCNVSQPTWWIREYKNGWEIYFAERGERGGRRVYGRDS